jgi:recombinational DNA repair ATPase RecF
MDDALHRIVVDRVAQARLSDDVGLLVLAACEGQDQLDAVLGGASMPRPRAGEHTGEGEPVGAYLRSVQVEGFRGIGPEAALGLVPGPGLTLVVGRNGSGKSSFAEALELLLTRDSRRWSKPRSAVWREGWRNVHHTGPTRLRADLIEDGESGPTRVSRSWDADQGLEDGKVTVQRAGQPVVDLATLGWQRDLVRYRPFLSYNEVGSMFDSGPTQLYETLALVLGLEELTEAGRELKEARLQRRRLVDRVTEELDGLRPELVALDDDRARRCAEALAGKVWKLDQLAATLAGQPASPDDRSPVDVLTGLAALMEPDAAEVTDTAARLRAADSELTRLAGTDADRARRTAKLLTDALMFHAAHGDGDCPVCGRRQALTPDWRADATAEAERLEGLAAEAEVAATEAQAARRQAHALLRPAPRLLQEGPTVGVATVALAEVWERWAHGIAIDDLLALADHLEATHTALAAETTTVRRDARVELARREDRWRPLAERMTAWLIDARDAVAAKTAVANLKAAQAWLEETATEIRNERFAPIAEEALENWRLLRHDSNVDVERIVFAGKATLRRVDLGVTVDGVGSAALGVMSQGELHALALSLFLPRAMLPESPFRFVVIDDPVQSMDPARVDGLARVLERAAGDRQVVVFTHDDRLPEAVRRLGIDARVLEVSREPRSVVRLRPALDPVRRHLEDAMALAATEDLPREVAVRVVPAFCRLAIESACTDVARRRLLGRGVRHDEVERRLLASRTLSRHAALALFEDPERAGEVLRYLTNRFGGWAADTFKATNKGTHMGMDGDLRGLVDRTDRLTKELQAL